MAKQSPKTLDPRFFFVIHTKHTLYIWKGSQVPKANVDKYTEVAQSWCWLLQENERAPQKVVTVNQGDEGAEFWEMFGPGAKTVGVIEEWRSIDVS